MGKLARGISSRLKARFLDLSETALIKEAADEIAAADRAKKAEELGLSESEAYPNDPFAFLMRHNAPLAF